MDPRGRDQIVTFLRSWLPTPVKRAYRDLMTDRPDDWVLHPHFQDGFVMQHLLRGNSISDDALGASLEEHCRRSFVRRYSTVSTHRNRDGPEPASSPSDVHPFSLLPESAVGVVICAWCRQIQSDIIEGSWTSHTICRWCVVRTETFPESYLLTLPAGEFGTLPFPIAEVDSAGCVRTSNEAEPARGGRRSLFDLLPWSEFGVEPMFRALARGSIRGGRTRIVQLGAEPEREILLVEMAYDPDSRRGVISARPL